MNDSRTVGQKGRLSFPDSAFLENAWDFDPLIGGGHPWKWEQEVHTWRGVWDWPLLFLIQAGSGGVRKGWAGISFPPFPVLSQGRVRRMCLA